MDEKWRHHLDQLSSSSYPQGLTFQAYASTSRRKNPQRHLADKHAQMNSGLMGVCIIQFRPKMYLGMCMYHGRF